MFVRQKRLRLHLGVDGQRITVFKLLPIGIRTQILHICNRARLRTEIVPPIKDRIHATLVLRAGAAVQKTVQTERRKIISKALVTKLHRRREAAFGIVLRPHQQVRAAPQHDVNVLAKDQALLRVVAENRNLEAGSARCPIHCVRHIRHIKHWNLVHDRQSLQLEHAALCARNIVGGEKIVR